jgi:hypothetical protein
MLDNLFTLVRLVIHLDDGQESLLRNADLADGLHALFALCLLI